MARKTTTQLIWQLKTLKKAVLEDGVVDWDETEQLRKAIRPLAVRRGFIFEDYERLLKKCREDGKISPNESRELALQLEFLCNLFFYKRLTFWLSATVVALVIACSLILFHDIASSADTSSLREAKTGEMPPP